jgi:hypothetical protein
MSVVVMVVVRLFCFALVVDVQQRHAGQVHHKPHHSDRQRDLEVDGQGGHEPLHRLDHHGHGHQPERQGAGVPRDGLHLAGAERERAVGCEATGEHVGGPREAQRADVRGHVPAVRQERHGVGGVADHDLHHHHQGRQQHHPPHARAPSFREGAAYAWRRLQR